MNTVYEVNRGINRSLEFKGVKAQYVIYLGLGMVVLLLLFSVLYLIGVSTYVSLGIIIPGGVVFVVCIQQMSRKYGEHGLLKKMATKKLPASVQSRSRKLFISLKNLPYEKK